MNGLDPFKEVRQDYQTKQTEFIFNEIVGRVENFVKYWPSGWKSELGKRIVAWATEKLIDTEPKS